MTAAKGESLTIEALGHGEARDRVAHPNRAPKIAGSVHLVEAPSAREPPRQAHRPTWRERAEQGAPHVLGRSVDRAGDVVDEGQFFHTQQYGGEALEVNTPPYGRSEPMTPDAKLSTSAWVTAALAALANGGVANLSIERLARELGVTKGSFYWHFANRDALLSAALAYWEQTFTEVLITDAREVQGARERLVRLIGRVVRGADADRIHIALASDDHPLVRATLARVTKRRLDFLEQCYGDLGQTPEAARQSALLAYSAYVGLVHLRIEAPSAIPTRDAFRSYVDAMIERLVPPDGNGCADSLAGSRTKRRR